MSRRDKVEDDYSRVVSASSSFFRLILSLSVSASRRACWMRACIASGDTSLGRPWSIVDAVLGNQVRNWRRRGEVWVCRRTWRWAE